MKRRLYLNCITAWLCVFLLALPLCALVFQALQGGALAESVFAWDEKSVSALCNSLGLSLAVVVLSIAWAGISLWIIARLPSFGVRLAFFATLLILFCLSPVIHLVAWRSLPLANLCPSFVATTLVLSSKYFPLVVFVLLLGLHSLAPGGIEAGLSVSRLIYVLWRLVLPQLKWLFLLLCLVIFSLVFAESEVPPILGLRVYAEEFMSRVALDLYASSTLVAAIPFAVLAVLVAICLFFTPLTAAHFLLRKSGLGALQHHFSPLRYAWGWALVLLAWVSWPVWSLLSNTQWALLNMSDVNALFSSLQLACASMLLAFALAFPIAKWLCHAGLGHKWGLAWMLVLLCLPGSLTGLGMLALAQLPYFAWLANWDISLIVTHSLRFIPIAVLLLLGLRLLEAKWIRDELSLLGAGAWSILRFVRIPLDSMKWMVVGLMLLTLILAELSSTILVVAPGTETAILRLYNLMHYGAAERVSALALLQAGTIVLFFGGITALYARFGRYA